MEFIPEMSGLLTLKEASKLLNIHPNTLRNWEKQGKIEAVRIGSRRDRRFTSTAIWRIYHRNS